MFTQSAASGVVNSKQQVREIRLLLKGVGWRGSVINVSTAASRGLEGRKQSVRLHVGYSHPVVIPIPDGVKVVCSSRARSTGAGSGGGGGGARSPNLQAGGARGQSHGQGQSEDGTVLLLSTDPRAPSGQQPAAAASQVLLGDFAARLQSVRPWSPYTGHGIVKRFSFSRLGRASPSQDNARSTVSIPAPRKRKVGKRK
jgi:hypothetical protein